MIVQQEAIVYYAPTKGRRYFSKRSAIIAEAKAIIYKKYPPIPFDTETGECYSMELDEPERYGKMHRRLSRQLIK
mgnify:CR=1 FL=1